jgi:hypothetical protein
MNLKEFLIQEYQKQGWMVIPDIGQAASPFLENWAGSNPDIIALKGNRKLAICIETASGFIGDSIPKKWKSILANAGFSLLVIARDRETHDLALRTARLNGIAIECRIMKKVVYRRRRTSYSLFQRRVRLFSILIALALAFIAVFMLFPSARKNMQSHLQMQILRSYTPNNVERQMDTLKKEMQKLDRVR